MTMSYMFSCHFYTPSRFNVCNNSLRERGESDAHQLQWMRFHLDQHWCQTRWPWICSTTHPQPGGENTRCSHPPRQANLCSWQPFAFESHPLLWTHKDLGSVLHLLVSNLALRWSPPQPIYLYTQYLSVSSKQQLPELWDIEQTIL